MGKEKKRELIQRHTEAECEKGFYVTFYCMLIYLLSPEFIYFGFWQFLPSVQKPTDEQ